MGRAAHPRRGRAEHHQDPQGRPQNTNTEPIGTAGDTVQKQQQRTTTFSLMKKHPYMSLGETTKNYNADGLAERHYTCLGVETTTKNYNPVEEFPLPSPWLVGNNHSAKLSKYRPPPIGCTWAEINACEEAQENLDLERGYRLGYTGIS